MREEKRGNEASLGAARRGGVRWAVEREEGLESWKWCLGSCLQIRVGKLTKKVTENHPIFPQGLSSAVCLPHLSHLPSAQRVYSLGRGDSLKAGDQKVVESFLSRFPDPACVDKLSRAQTEGWE